MKIETHDINVHELLNSSFFRIPRYQRPYSWDDETLSQFWRDVVDERSGEYFIGSIVLYEAGEERQTYFVVDGQQRITSIILMLCAARDVLHNEEFSDLSDGIHSIIERKILDNTTRFVLASESSVPVLADQILKKGEAEIDVEQNSEQARLIKAYKFFQSKFKSLIDDIEERHENSSRKKLREEISAAFQEIRNSILDLKVIRVNLDNEDDAYVVFETLNTRGKDLDVSDLVKNHIMRFKRARNTDLDVAKEKWSSILASFEESAAKISMKSFLHHQWLSKKDYISQKQLFIKGIKQISTKRGVEQYLDELVNDSVRYRVIFEPESRKKKWTIEQNSIVESLHALSMFGIRYSVPYILSVYRAWEEKRLTLKNTISALRSIESFHFINEAVCEERATGGSSMMFAAAARRVDAADKSECFDQCRDLNKKLRERVPEQKIFSLNFSLMHHTNTMTVNRKIVFYILKKYMEHLGQTLDRRTLTIEHLAPQSSNSTYIGNIGNLILVPEKVNEKLADKSFSAKIKILNANQISLDSTIKNSDRWSKKEVIDRTSLMSKVAYENIWTI